MMRHMRPVSDASTNGSSDRLATVVEAAEILGITPDAVRSRLRRGTLKRSPERGEDGEVLVVLPSHKTADQSNEPSGMVDDQPVDQSGTVSNQSATDSDASATVALMEHMESEITHLREQLDKEREANRENRRLLAAALERIPAIEAGDERESPVTATEGTDRGEASPEQQEPVERRSWLYRFFFGP
jgi:hypothetical protein